MKLQEDGEGEERREREAASLNCISNINVKYKRFAQYHNQIITIIITDWSIHVVVVGVLLLYSLGT